MVYFLAFLMERKMELLLQSVKDETNISPEKIRESLNSMQLAAVTTSNGEMLIKSTCKPLGKAIFKRLHINQPANISNRTELIEKLELNRTPEHIQMTSI